jgi:hypothetical protein
VAQIRQSRPDSGLGFDPKALTFYSVVPSSLESGLGWTGFRVSDLGFRVSGQERLKPGVGSRVWGVPFSKPDSGFRG